MKRKLAWESVGHHERIVARLEYDPFKFDDDEDAYLWFFELEYCATDSLGGDRWERVGGVPQYLLTAMLKGLGVDLEEYTPLYSDAEPETQDE